MLPLYSPSAGQLWSSAAQLCPVLPLASPPPLHWPRCLQSKRRTKSADDTYGAKSVHKTLGRVPVCRCVDRQPAICSHGGQPGEDATVWLAPGQVARAKAPPDSSTDQLRVGRLQDQRCRTCLPPTLRAAHTRLRGWLWHASPPGQDRRGSRHTGPCAKSGGGFACRLPRGRNRGCASFGPVSGPKAFVCAGQSYSRPQAEGGGREAQRKASKPPHTHGPICEKSKCCQGADRQGVLPGQDACMHAATRSFVFTGIPRGRCTNPGHILPTSEGVEGRCFC